MTTTAAHSAKAWPFEEARALLTRLEKLGKKTALFETGYGPSGLPHIGTFGEVARTSMVRHAFEVLTEGQYKTHLICFSDDMDGLRKVPDNLPNPEMIRENIGRPLTSVPDPFGTHESFGHHMNARLRAFLDTFGFSYEFKSSTETYKSGAFDTALLTILANYDKVMKVMLPTLGDERAETYSPFLPISPISGKVLLAKVVRTDIEKGTITYIEEDGSEMTVPVTGGHCKLQWKPDMGMRWAALGVDYEMYGKDHLASAKLYDSICRIAGGTPPQQMMFELFLDANGEKISKSKGNGITIDEWLKYAPEESLALYMFTKPRTAKKLHFDVIPQQVDDYLTYLEKYNQTLNSGSETGSGGKPSPLEGEGLDEGAANRAEPHRHTPSPNPLPQGERASPVAPLSPQILENPAWHIHAGRVPAPESSIKFSMLLNLVSACNAEHTSTLWGFLKRALPNATPENSPMLDKLCGYAVRYYHDFVKPTKQYRAPTELERTALSELREYLVEISRDGAAAYLPLQGGGRREAAGGGHLPAHLEPPPGLRPTSPLEGEVHSPTADDIMTRIYDLGLKYYSKETMREWFKAMYETLLGSSQGPRMGSFIHLFGAQGTIGLIDAALAQKAAA
jgi:lysyl-tRNA synthetase class 1